MSKICWLSRLITYLVPCSVSIHGQHTSRIRTLVQELVNRQF